MAQQEGRHVHGGHEHHAAAADRRLSAGVLTCSDRGARGESEDASGPTIRNLLRERLGAEIAAATIVPDDRPEIESTLIDWCDNARLDLILTTGGTGLSPRDVTPEATRAVVDREVPAITAAMLFESLRKTPYAMLTRATAGVRGRTLIVNLPGNPAAVRENLEAVLEVLPHAVDVLQGRVQHGAAAGHGPDGAHESHGGHAGHAAHKAKEPDGAGIARNVGGPPC